MFPDLAPADQLIAAIDWIEVVKAAPSFAVAIIAFLALKNWKRQDKAKRQAEFLDGLVEAMHAYIVEMARPINLLEFAKIGMESHAPAGADGDEMDKKVKGAIAFIQKRGEEDGKLIIGALNNARPSVLKLRSFSAKGQVFQFKDYPMHHHAIELMAQQFNMIEAFASITRSHSYNWDNPRVIETLKSVLEIDPEKMRKTIEDSNIIVLKFVSDTNKRLYG